MFDQISKSLKIKSLNRDLALDSDDSDNSYSASSHESDYVNDIDSDHDNRKRVGIRESESESSIIPPQKGKKHNHDKESDNIFDKLNLDNNVRDTVTVSVTPGVGVGPGLLNTEYDSETDSKTVHTDSTKQRQQFSTLPNQVNTNFNDNIKFNLEVTDSPQISELGKQQYTNRASESDTAVNLSRTKAKSWKSRENLIRQNNDYNDHDKKRKQKSLTLNQIHTIRDSNVTMQSHRDVQDQIQRQSLGKDSVDEKRMQSIAKLILSGAGDTRIAVQGVGQGTEFGIPLSQQYSLRLSKKKRLFKSSKNNNSELVQNKFSNDSGQQGSVLGSEDPEFHHDTDFQEFLSNINDNNTRSEPSPGQQKLDHDTRQSQHNINQESDTSSETGSE